MITTILTCSESIRILEWSKHSLSSIFAATPSIYLLSILLVNLNQSRYSIPLKRLRISNESDKHRRRLSLARIITDSVIAPRLFKPAPRPAQPPSTAGRLPGSPHCPSPHMRPRSRRRDGAEEARRLGRIRRACRQCFCWGCRRGGANR